MKFPPEFTQTFQDTQKALFNIGNTTFGSREQFGNITTLFSSIQDSLFDNFGIDPPESDGVVTDPNEEWNENLGVLALVVCCALVFLLSCFLRCSSYSKLSSYTHSYTFSLDYKYFLPLPPPPPPFHSRPPFPHSFPIRSSRPISHSQSNITPIQPQN